MEYLKTFFLSLSLYVSICVCRLNLKYEGKTKRRMKDRDIFIHTPAFHFVSILHLSRVEVLHTSSRSVPKVVTPLDHFLYTKM